MASGIVGYGVRGFGVWVGGLGFPWKVSSSKLECSYDVLCKRQRTIATSASI